MAQKYILLSVLWIAVAIVGIVSQNATTTPDPSTATPNTSTTATLSTSPPATPNTTESTTPNTTESTTPNTTESTTPNTTESTTPNTPKPETPTEFPTTTEPPPPAPCESSPCLDGSTCNNFGPNNFTCSCVAGETYDLMSQTCMKAKSFPGELTVPGIPFSNSMLDQTSEAFLEAAQTITDELRESFSDIRGYSGSRVLEINEAVTRMTGVIASVENSFEANSDVTSSDVTTALKTASECSGCLLAGSSFTGRDLCDEGVCDADTMNCTSSDGSFTCTCLEGYINTTYSDRLCIACPSGSKATGSECEKCSFGYSGFNCKENWQLLLVIIGSVLGGLLLICFIILPVVALKSPKKSSKKKNDADIGKPYITHSSAKSPLVNSNVANSQATSLNGSAYAFTNPGVPQIPRATTNSPWDSKTNLEMIPSHSRHNLISEGRNSRPYDDQDDIRPYGLSRQNSQYSQRPQGNPYGQTRAQFNPYAQNQGHSNPYFQRDSGR